MTFDTKLSILFAVIEFFHAYYPHSDPYVRIDLNTIDGDINLDSVLTKTKKKVRAQHVAVQQMSNCDL